MHDVIIIGAGPVGLACGIEAQRAGLRALILEKGALINSFLGYPTNMTFFSTPELMEIGGHPFPTTGYKPQREEAIDYYRRVAQAEDLDVHLYERVLRVDGHDGAFRVSTDKSTYATRKVIVAIGFFDQPNMMGVDGEDLPKVIHYYKEPFRFSGQRVAVVGAKNSAAIAALTCYRHGSEVTLVVRGGALSPSIKYWLRPDLENRIDEGSIRAFFQTSVTAVTPDAIHLATPEGPLSLPNDWVLAMTGYHPDYAFLHTLGIDTQPDAYDTPRFDPDTFETNRRGVYLAGTVCGGRKTGKWFIENGRLHARQIVQHIQAGEVVSVDFEHTHWKTAE